MTSGAECSAPTARLFTSCRPQVNRFYSRTCPRLSLATASSTQSRHPWPPGIRPRSLGDKDATVKSGSAALIGRPNSGKSTLLNALVGEKISIVSDKPQTTRHRIRGILNEPRGQVAFIDTPGVHKPQYRMNERMQQTTRDVMREADLVLLMIDASAAWGAGEKFTLEMFQRLKPRAMLLINKIDIVAKPTTLPI